jgi:succinoglycan biosynthesis transport protein ExoP
MKSEVLDLRILVEVIWPRRYAILLTSLLFAMLAYGLSGLLPLRFASDGLLIVDTPENQQTDTMAQATDIDVLRSPSLLANVVDALKLGNQKALVPSFRLPKIVHDRLSATSVPPKSEEDRQLAALDYLERHLSVSASSDSRVLSVGFDAGTPALAAAVVNELMREYIDSDYQAQRDLAARANGWLADQAKLAKRDADAAEQTVLAFQAKNPLIALQDGSVAALDLNRQWQQLSSARQDVVQAQLDLDTARADNGRSEASSPAADSLRQQETDVMRRLASAGASLGNDNPQRIALVNELQAVRRQITLENRNTVATREQRLIVAKAELVTIQADIAKASTAATAANANQTQLQSLMEMAQAKRSTYQGLVTRLQDAELAANQTTTARIVSAAVPPVKPQPSRRPINVALSLLTGAILATAYFLLRHLLNARIGSTMTLNELSGVPTVGALPRLRSQRQRMARIVMDNPNCAVAETLRGIRLAVDGMSTSGGDKVVLVSSAERGEGKTSVAAALALRAADDGLRVLLIEGDLHRPRLAKELGLTTPVNGLEAVLSGGNYHGNLLQTHPTSDLHCLLAAGSARNPVALLEGKRFTTLINDARAIYDLIIIDSPPVLRVADPVILARSADRILLVVREDRTPRRDVIEAINRFPRDRQGLLVTLLVDARTSRAGAQGYYAGYDAPRSSPWSQSRPMSSKDASQAVVPQGRNLSTNRL